MAPKPKPMLIDGEQTKPAVPIAQPTQVQALMGAKTEAQARAEAERARAAALARTANTGALGSAALAAVGKAAADKAAAEGEARVKELAAQISAASAAAVPAKVDKYQATIETDRLKPGSSLAPTPDPAPDPSEVYGGIVAPYSQPGAASSPKAIATSAKELAGASPAKVGDVIDKLKAEEARGGPGFWDVLQAAAAGWQGQVPLYVQKELARKEEEAVLARAKEVMGLEASQRAEERAASQAFQRDLAREEMENRLKLAGIGTFGGGAGMGGLNLGDLMIPGLGGK